MNTFGTAQHGLTDGDIVKMIEQLFDLRPAAIVRDLKLKQPIYEEQKRKTGEPYIIHPIAVARIVAEELELGANPVMAAFLHDVVEDTQYTIEDIRERFGEDVALRLGLALRSSISASSSTFSISSWTPIPFLAEISLESCGCAKKPKIPSR